MKNQLTEMIETITFKFQCTEEELTVVGETEEGIFFKFENSIYIWMPPRYGEESGRYTYAGSLEINTVEQIIG